MRNLNSLLNEIVTVAVDLIEPHPKNPRIGNVGEIKKSLEANKQFKPLLVQRSTNCIIAGNHCVDAETEALTQRGWVTGWEINEDDIILSVDSNRSLVWGPVRSIFRNETYSGPMHRLENRTFTSLVSPGHRFMVNEGELREVENLRTKDKLILMGSPLESAGDTYSDAFVELVGWAVTEGSYRKPGSHRNYGKPYVRISQLPGSYAERIRRSLESVGAAFQVGRGWRQGRVLSFNVRGDVARTLYDVAPNRVMTMDFLTSLSEAQRDLLIETMVDADGHRIYHKNSVTRCFTQLSPESMDRFTALCAMSGLTTSVVTRIPPKTSGEYRNSKPYMVASVRNQQTSSLEKGKIRRTVEEYSGLIWCPETDYGTFICRRNGKVHLTGNTYKAAVELEWSEIDVVYLDVDDVHAEAIMLADNKLAEFGSYNDQLLADLISGILDADESLLEGTGYSDSEIDELLSGSIDYEIETDGAGDDAGFTAAMLDRIMPHDGDDDDDDDELAIADVVPPVNSPSVVPAEFVVFRFGELRAKVPRKSYDSFVTRFLKDHHGDLALAGVGAAVRLGIDQQDVEPAVAQGAERWL